MSALDRLTDEFPAFAGDCPTVRVRAPGRVNLIGEHTDYNEGFVLPIAIDAALFVVAAPREDGRIRFRSLDEPPMIEINLAALPKRAPAGWPSYVVGVATLLARAGARLHGANLLIASDIPLGAGLSSSAALEAGVALALLRIAGDEWDRVRIADLCRKAEHDFAGTPCGIMDQFACLLAQPGCALLLDCRTRAIEHVPLPSRDAEALIIDTQVRHTLSDGEYARRVAECRRAMAHFAARRSDIRALRDVTPGDLAAHAEGLDPIALKRARHVVEENDRVHAFVAALRSGDLSRAGAVMYGSHASLRDLYEVSCRELDNVVEAVRGVPGVIGARMTGGGFGGSVVALVRPGAADAVRAAMDQLYDPHHKKRAIIRATSAAAGASVI